MNRNKLKAYAPKARRDFIKAVTDRAAFYRLMKDKIEPITEQGDVAIIGGTPFPKDVAKKRKRLEERIRREGFEQVMEAMAYTWFNRFVAIRFMELHGYLGHGYRVLSTTNSMNDTDAKNRKAGSLEIPDILRYAEHVDLPELDREKVVELKLAGNRDEELYRMLLIGQCNALHKAMPFLFEWIGDATELLLPENLLHSDSLIRKMINEIPEEEWERVEIIGWLYQFYISEKKDQVIGKVVKSEDIPAGTQLFTPNWIVKYMVQNTLGRQWVATYPNSPLKQQMEYYIEPGEQTPEVREQLKAITPESLNPEELTLLDPACGSGHILVEAYELLKAIYQERGYRAKDIPRLILEKNLYGLEIDDRAAQLAAFALMMKARAYDRRIFENGIWPHVLAIQETKDMDAQKITEALNTPIVKGELPTREMLFEEMDEARAPLFSRKNLSVKGELSQDDVAQLIELFEHGKTFGSLIRVPEDLAEKLSGIAERVEDVLAYGEMFGKAAAETLRPIVEQAWVLVRKYDAVVTNPPYMGSNFFSPELKRLINTHFAEAKSDLYSCFVQRNLEWTRKNGFTAMITIPNWMFLSSFQSFRLSLLNEHTIDSFIHCGRGIFGSDFGTCCFSIRNERLTGYFGLYKRLFDKISNVAPIDKLRRRFFVRPPFMTSQDDLAKIPGSPIAYWVTESVLNIFESEPPLSQFADTRQGLATGKNDTFLRFWHEVAYSNMQFSSKIEQQTKASQKKWFRCQKGGPRRRWYGNHGVVVDWYNNGKKLKAFSASVIRNEGYYFRKGLTWSSLSIGAFSMRISPEGFLFESKGSMCFPHDNSDIYYILGFANTKLVDYFLSALAPTVDYHEGPVGCLPFRKTEKVEIQATVLEAVEISKIDWNSFETSWDFKVFPLIEQILWKETILDSYCSWVYRCKEAIRALKELEERNNFFFLGIYGLQDELSSEVPEDQITLYRPEQEEDIKRLISYAIGCIMGRYSLDQPGLTYAHSGNDQFWEIYHEKHNKPAPAQNKNHSCNSCDPWSTLPPDQDGIIPITDMDWFPDDAANRFLEFISVAWPKEHLEENLKFVAESLSPNLNESPRETIRRYMATGFFKHHMKMYKKRPIYWLFSSGKLRAFQCLVYLHRYNEGTLSRVRTEYVIPLQGKISARIEQLSGDINAATSTAHRKKLERERDKLVKQQAELQTFDEKLRHYADQRISLDLDDGVKVNYGKFGNLLAEVQAVTGKKKE